MMILINYGRPFKPDQIAQLEALVHETIDQVVDVSFKVDPDQPVQPQLIRLLRKIPVSNEALMTEPIIVQLPSQNYQAALVMADLHGRMGYFPRVVRTTLRAGGGLLLAHDVCEVLDPQSVEDAASAGISL